MSAFSGYGYVNVDQTYDAVRNLVSTFGNDVAVGASWLGNSLINSIIPPAYGETTSTANDVTTDTITTGGDGIPSNGIQETIDPTANLTTINFFKDDPAAQATEVIGGDNTTLNGSNGPSLLMASGDNVTAKLGSGLNEVLLEGINGTVSGGDDAQVEVDGQAATIRLGDDANLTDNASGSSVTLQSGTVTLGAGDTGTVTGEYNTFNLTSYGGTLITYGGANTIISSTAFPWIDSYHAASAIL
jgi:hypothetical protein